MDGPDSEYDEHGKKKRLDWTRAEALLAFDVYVRGVPIHPRSKQYPTFRNANGVYNKLLNLQHAEKVTREERGSRSRRT